MATLKRKAAPAPAPDAKKPKSGTLTSFFTKSEPAAAAAPRFNKDKWVAGLSEEQRQLLKLEIDTMDESWLAVLKDEIVTKEFLELKRFLEKEDKAGRKVFPPKEDIYSWSRHTPFHTVKVVIVGQDPYHNHNQAHGLAFSVRPPTPAPPSLKNMYIALKNDYPDFTPPPNRGGLLTPWADRGVLMLNTCLTVRAHDPKSHGTRGWERLTQRAIDLVAARRTRGVVFMAWGTPAGMCVKKVDAEKNLVLRAVHPSPLSASRGFFTCGHFKKANEWLVGKYGAGSEVDWSLGPRQAKIEFGAVKKEEAVKGDDEAEKKVSKVEAAAGVKTDVVETAEAKKAEVETPAAVEEKPEAVAGTSVAKTDAAAAKPDTRVEATSATKRVTRAETAATKFVKTDSAAKDVDDVKKLVTDASKDEDKENKKVEVGE